MPKIGVSAYQLYPGQVGGVETYIRDLITHLPDGHDSLRYALIGNSDNEALLRKLKPAWPVVTLPSMTNELLSLDYRLKRKIFNLLQWVTPPTQAEVTLNELLEAAEFDLVHFPQTVIYPLSLPIPCLLTFWDLQHEYFPEYFDESILRWRLENYQASAQKARLIIVPSVFTKNSLTDKYGIPPEKIKVVRFGVSDRFWSNPADHVVREVRSRYKLPESYFFYPAASYRHKNHIRLLQAFHQVNSRYPELKLVLTGMSYDAEPDIQRTVERLSLHNDVIRLGFVPYQDLPHLYAGAVALVFPSQFEGYGLPVLEAMASGCPVICSDSTSLPELVEDAALQIDPFDVEDLVRSMELVWEDVAVRRQLSRAGRRRAAEFSWQRAIEALEASYLQALL
jgi:glycosyltransferase involved in cell wall biosynthesis